MSDKNILFEIKTLEKIIVRQLVHNTELIYKPTPTQMQILEYLLEKENEEVYQKDLEKILNLRRATVSGVLKTMEKNNLIKRIPSSKDTRTKQLILNEQTKTKFFEIKNKIEDIEKKITKDISNEDLEQFLNILNRMKKNIENKEEENV